MGCDMPVTLIPFAWRRLSRDGVKVIALSAMVSAYVAEAFAARGTTAYNVLTAFGQISFPLFCVLFAQGFPYVRDRWFHVALLAFSAFLSEFAFDIAVSHVELVPELDRQNVMFTWLFIFIMLWLIEIVQEKVTDKRLSVLLRAGLVFLFTALMIVCQCDYGEVAALCTIWAYMWTSFSVDPLVSCVCVAFVVAMIYNNYWSLLAIAVFAFYNPKVPGNYIRGAFYVAYPVCLTCLSVIRLIIS